ncbi:MAG: endonuclease/exonuclease/phosphatase family protein [Bacilli bacterium]|nr:endonuclease/exonuclease/phosphatase family protein [Bacilli bacterium]
MKVASFNIKHRIFNDNLKISNKVFDIINENKIDVLCTQEIPRSMARKFKKVMNGYNILGDSRYHHYLKSLPFNEKNPIITKRNVIHTKTIRYKNKIKNIKEFFRYLKNIPIIPRIATLIVIKTDNKKDICIINTHLDYKFSVMQKKELKELTELVKEYHQKYDVILTGDFNMDEEVEHFKLFISDLEKENIYKVNLEGYTWRSKKGKEKKLDYIFISKSLTINDFGIIKSNDLSDHEIVYVDINA